MSRKRNLDMGQASYCQIWLVWWFWIEKKFETKNPTHSFRDTARLCIISVTSGFQFDSNPDVTELVHKSTMFQKRFFVQKFFFYSEPSYKSYLTIWSLSHIRIFCLDLFRGGCISRGLMTLLKVNFYSRLGSCTFFHDKNDELCPDPHLPCLDPPCDTPFTVFLRFE